MEKSICSVTFPTLLSGQSSDYLLSLINDVLDISRIESGNISYDPEPVNITAVTDSVLDITHGFTINRDLQLIVHRDEPETIMCWLTK